MLLLFLCTFCLFSLFLASAISVLQKAFCCLCNLLFSLVFFFLGGFTLGSLIYLFTYKFFALSASRKFTVCLVSCIRSSQFKFYSLTHTHKHSHVEVCVCIWGGCSFFSVVSGFYHNECNPIRAFFLFLFRRFTSYSIKRRTNIYMLY